MHESMHIPIRGGSRNSYEGDHTAAPVMLEKSDLDLEPYLKECGLGNADFDVKKCRHRLRSYAYKYEVKRLGGHGYSKEEAKAEACKFATRTAERFDEQVGEDLL